MRILNSLIVPENVKGVPFGIFNIYFVAKYQKIEGGPLVLSDFVCYVEIVEMQKGPFPWYSCLD